MSRCVRFHPNANYVVTGSMDKTVRVWDVQTGNCVRLLAGHAGGVTCVAVSPSGRLVCLWLYCYSIVLMMLLLLLLLSNYSLVEPRAIKCYSRP